MLAHSFPPKLLFIPLLSLGISAASAGSSAATQVYTIEQAVQRSQEIDPWILKSQFQQESLQAQSISRGSLPDPSVNFGVA
ncbi:MAG: hypothetical protein ACI9W1_003346, partial [Candidatus Azotimanducaceae bacterium]